VVEGEDPRAPAGRTEGGEHRLLEDRRRAAVAAHPVPHPDEGGGRDHGGAGGERGDRAPARAEEREQHEEAAAARAVAEEGREGGRGGAAPEPGGEGGADRRLRPPEAREPA
jgi:hypothetical protein